MRYRRQFPGVNQSQVQVTGTATLGGTVGLHFDTNYSPVPGDAFELLTAVNVQGQFPFHDGFLLLGQNEQMQIDYGGTNVVVTAVSAPDPDSVSLQFGSQGGLFMVTWPSEFADLALYAKTNLADPEWTLVSTTNRYMESVSTAPEKFFHLQSP